MDLDLYGPGLKYIEKSVPWITEHGKAQQALQKPEEPCAAQGIVGLAAPNAKSHQKGLQRHHGIASGIQVKHGFAHLQGFPKEVVAAYPQHKNEYHKSAAAKEKSAYPVMKYAAADGKPPGKEDSDIDECTKRMEHPKGRKTAKDGKKQKTHKRSRSFLLDPAEPEHGTALPFTQL